MHIALASLLFCAAGCKTTDGPAAWALNYATVQADGDTLAGVHVWEFFAEGWEKKQKEDYYKCSFVQSISGTATSPEVEGCVGCTHFYSVVLTAQDGDCDESLSSDPALGGLRGFGLGEIEAGFAEEDPFPGGSVGWYISFDGVTAMFHGFAFPEALERGGSVDPDGWSSGQSYTLWPVYAWAL